MGKLLPLKPWLASEDKIISEMLGLTPEEYKELSHSGIKEVCDMDNNVLYFYMEVSPLNPESILRKLNMNKSRMIFLPADYKERKKQLQELV